MSSQTVKALSLLGLRIKDGKITRESFCKVFGGTYKEPEWIVMNDYKVRTPFDYVKYVEIEETKIDRVMMPSSFSITRFGNFLDDYGNEVILDALVYQYSMAKNPRNVHYAYRLFLDGTTVSKNSGMPSVHAAKQECANQAEDLIKTELYDIS